MTGRLFNLALQYQTYLTERSHSSKQNRVDAPSNIFDRLQLRQQQPKDLFSAKHYEIVGLKELKSLQNKLRKGKKNTYRKETYLRQDTSREDEKQKFMTKKQVMDSLPRIEHKEDQSKLKKIGRGHFKTQVTEVGSDSVPLQNVQSARQDSDFSLSRLKLVIEARNEEWKKIQEQTGRENPKFPSVYKSIELFRGKIEEKMKNARLEDLTNQNSHKWPSILRRDLSLADVALKKPITRTFHDEGEFSARGNSKFKSEESWLQKKYEEGYYFKKYVGKEKVVAQPLDTMR